MPKIFMLRHAFAEQQATLEDASKFRTHHRPEEVSPKKVIFSELGTRQIL